MHSQQYTINLKQDTAWQMHRLHFHDSMEFLLTLSGDGEIFLDKEVYPLHKNTLCIMPSNHLHRTATDPNGGIFERYVLNILPELIEHLSTSQTNFLYIIRHSAPCLQLSEEQTRRLITLFEQLRVPAAAGGFGWDVRQHITLLQIFLQICDSVQATPLKSDLSNPDYEKVQPILSYIDENFTEPLSLEGLASHFMVSRHYLSHIFKKGTGFSVMEYVIQLRILEAQRLLRDGVSVQDAGEKAGFQSYAHFIRTFSTYVGTSPGQYGKRFRGGERAPLLKEMTPGMS